MDGFNLVQGSSGLSIASWNIEGLASKLGEPGFMDYVLSFDICCLLETFTPENFDFSSLSNENVVFHAPAVKLSHRGRRSGGVVIMAKRAIAQRIFEVKCAHDNMIILRISGFTSDVIMVCVYVPPLDSPYYNGKNVKCNILLLEEELLELQQNYPKSSVLVCGDFNARTDEWNIHRTIECDSDDDEQDELNSNSCYCPVGVMRSSQDRHINQFGRLLINVCKIYHLCILNGSTAGDSGGNMTYISQHGDSVVDYALFHASTSPPYVDLKVGDNVISSHMPLEMFLSVNANHHYRMQPSSPVRKETKFIWKDERVPEVVQNLQCDEVKSNLRQATEMIDCNIDKALDFFTQTLHSVAQCMQCTVKTGMRVRSCPRWFDLDCQLAKRDARKALTYSRNSGLAVDRKHYVILRNQYKTLIREKKETYSKELCQNLINHVSNSAAFWPLVRKTVRVRSINPPIEMKEWQM